jgi:hypothetical protein
MLALPPRPSLDALFSDSPAADRADKMDLYARFFGRWDMDSVILSDDGSKQTGRGKIHFLGFVLEGRAIQDVWILPGVFYGTTLRIYDPGLGAWHILWNDALRPYFVRQIGRPLGTDIVQEGKDDSGTPLRWSFTEITRDSFHWIGERSADAGATWRLQVEFFARRVTS